MCAAFVCYCMLCVQYIYGFEYIVVCVCVCMVCPMSGIVCVICYMGYEYVYVCVLHELHVCPMCP